METKRNSFTFYRSFYEAINELAEENQFNLYKMIIKYSLDFETPKKLNGVEKTVWTLIEPFLSSNNNKYLNGKAPKKQKGSKAEAENKPHSSETGTNRDRDRDRDKEKEADAFFDSLYRKYPRKERKNDALKHYRKTVNNEQDRQDIENALDNYVKQKKGIEARYIMQAGTWFNNWKDWIPSQPKEKEPERLRLSV
jgi:hypothetical protein